MRALLVLALFAAVAFARYEPRSYFSPEETFEQLAPVVEESDAFVPIVFEDFDDVEVEEVAAPLVEAEKDDEEEDLRRVMEHFQDFEDDNDDEEETPLVFQDEDEVDDESEDDDFAPIVQAYQIPPQALELIKEFEGFYANAYADELWGWDVPTIGYGTTYYPDGRKVRRGDTATEAQATEWLNKYTMDTVVSKLARIPNWNKMNANQQSALISFAYNLGEGFYGSSDFASITALINDPSRWGDANDVLTQFYKYRNPGSSAEPGLARRRKAEAALFSKPASGGSPSSGSPSSGSCPSTCKSCINAAGGAGCASKCTGCATDCINCVKFGGGKQCAAKC